MIVLGLNGWGARSHDAAACLLVDGRIAAFAEEERFLRRKHAYDAAPHEAANFVLDAGGVALGEVDMVAFGWDLPSLLARHGQPIPDDTEIIGRLFPRDRFGEPPAAGVEFVPHHVAHAASAYLCSDVHTAGEADVAVLDGQGESCSATLGVGRRGAGFRVTRTIPVAGSLGYFYEAACIYAGLRGHDSGKLMGLAAHGTRRDYLDNEIMPMGAGYETPGQKADVTSVEGLDEQAEVRASWLRRFEEIVPRPAPLGGSPIDPFAMRDFAASVQGVLEDAVLMLLHTEGMPAAGRRLHLAGGIGFNATLNGLLCRRFGDTRVFVQPVAGDAGVALGAAAWVADQAGEDVAAMPSTTALGPAYSEDTMRLAIESAGLQFSEPMALGAAVAERICAGEVVGRFDGPAEVGPRALGHRSLLAAPAPAAMRDRINRDVKRREMWRPLAPSFHWGLAREIVGRDVGRPYMVVTDHVTAAWRERLAAVVHEDGTTRPQTVQEDADPRYFEILSEVGDRSGMAVVLNTSFNSRDEPIVSTPAGALASAVEMGVDSVAMGPFLVETRP